MGEYFSKAVAADKKPIGILATSAFGGICILDIQPGYHDYVVHADVCEKKIGNVSRSQLRTNNKGRNYFMRYGRRYYTDEFMRTD